MPSIELSIVRQGDPSPWADIDPARLVALADSDTLPVVALEAGMVTGAPSVALRINLADGTTALVETSLAVWIATTCAMRGAYPEAFAGTPLA